MTRGRIAAVAIAITVVTVVASGVAAAVWSASPARQATLTIATFSPNGSAVAAPATSVNSGTVTITPNAVTLPAMTASPGTSSRTTAINVSSWKLTRTGTTTGTFTCTGTSCTDTPGPGTYQYRVAPVYLGWTGGASTATGNVVVTPVPTITFAVAAGNGHRNVFSGTTTINSGTVTVKVYAGSTATGSPVRTYPASSFTGSGSPYGWSVTSGNNDLTNGSTYTAVASQIDGNANSSNSVTRTFTAA